MGAGNPPVAGADAREQGTPLVVARDRGPLARIRAPRRGSPGCGPNGPRPHASFPSEPRAFGTRTHVVLTVERRKMADVVATRTVGAALVAARIDPRQSSPILRTARDSTAPGPDNQPGDGAPSRVKVPANWRIPW